MVTQTPRIGFNSAAYYEAKAKLPQGDGIHCVICGDELPRGRRRYCSDGCAYWILNIKNIDWGLFAKKIMKRDGNKCFNCSSTSNLEVHHITPLKDGGKQFDEDNCLTLCFPCHRRTKEAHRNPSKFRKWMNEILEDRRKKAR